MGLMRTVVSLLLVGLVVACAPSSAGRVGSPSPFTHQEPLPSSPVQQASFEELRNRPLRLPSVSSGSVCPTTPTVAFKLNGNSVAGRGTGPFRFGPYGWPLVASDFNKTPWSVDPAYTGLVLVRGQRLDGPEQLTFGFWPAGFGTPAEQPGVPVVMKRHDVEGRTVIYQSELDISLDADRAGASRVGANMWSFPARGCYVVQADGARFTEVTIVEITASGWP
jgi:hypothetical protein